MRNKFSVIIVLFVLIFVTQSCRFRSPPDFEQQTKFAEVEIANDTELQRLDTLCRELPKPNNFQFLGKSAASRTMSAGYTYKTSLNYEQIKQFYDDYFGQNGWKLRDERPNWGSFFVYAKNSDYVSVQKLAGDEFCSVSCRDKS